MSSAAPLLPASAPLDSVRSLLPAISCAFQPIVDAHARSIVAYEALVRGAHGESAAEVFGSVPPALLAAFDEHCRTVALRHAERLGVAADLHLNLMPHSVQFGRDCLLSTRRAASHHRIPLHSLVIEITEQEIVGDEARFLQLCELYRGAGLRIALDDFGAGFSGLNILAAFQPDQLKLDQTFVRGVARHGPRQAIVRGVFQVCRDLGIDLIAEGIESRDEFSWFCDEGVHLFQGYFFARPGFESLPIPVFPS